MIIAADRKRYIRSLSGRAEVYNLIGLEREALADLNKVLQCDPDLSGKVNVVSCLSEIYVRLGRIQEARSCMDRIDLWLQGSRDPYLRGRALMIRAHVLRNTGDLRCALDAIHRAIGYYRRSPHCTAVRNAIAYCYLNIGIIHYGFGEYDQARKYFSESVCRMRKLGDRLGQIRSLNNIALIHWHWGDLGRAERLFLRTLRMAETIDYKDALGYILQNLGLVANDMNRHQEGLAKFAEAIRYAAEVGNQGMMANNYNNIGFIHERLHQYQAAYKNYARSRELFGAIGQLSGFAMAYNNCAGIACEWNRLRAALADVNQAVRIARRGGYTDPLVRSYKTKGKILACLGQDAASASALESAVRLAERHAMRGLAADAVLEYVNAAVAAWHRRGMSNYPRCRHYVAQVQEDIKQGRLIGIDAVIARLVLARYNAITGPVTRAEQLLASAIKKAGRVDDHRLAAEIALSRAFVLNRMGMPWQEELRKARMLARKVNAAALLAYLRELDAHFRHVLVKDTGT